MATQILASHAIPFPVVDSRKHISQASLTNIIELRRQVALLESSLTVAESEVKLALEAGAEVEAGLFRASLKITKRRNVSWKNVVERELGEDYAARVLAATRADSYTNLEVSL
jgi:hypothetical protein